MQSKSLILGLLLFSSTCKCAAFHLSCNLAHKPGSNQKDYVTLLRMAAIKRKRRPPPKPVYLTHERDFFRQQARLESMDSYVLVSTLTSSMSFGALLGFSPSSTTKAIIHIQGATVKFIYQSVCLGIQLVSGLSALFGLYATIIFSLTILYGKSALGVERDVQYDDFLRNTARARVNGFRCFSYSLGLFALLTVLVLVERTSFRFSSMPAIGIATSILVKLYKDWNLLFQSAEIIYREDD